MGLSCLHRLALRWMLHCSAWWMLISGEHVHAIAVHWLVARVMFSTDGGRRIGRPDNASCCEWMIMLDDLLSLNASG